TFDFFLDSPRFGRIAVNHNVRGIVGAYVAHGVHLTRSGYGHQNPLQRTRPPHCGRKSRTDQPGLCPIRDLPTRSPPQGRDLRMRHRSPPFAGRLIPPYILRDCTSPGKEEMWGIYSLFSGSCRVLSSLPLFRTRSTTPSPSLAGTGQAAGTRAKTS